MITDLYQAIFSTPSKCSGNGELGITSDKGRYNHKLADLPEKACRLPPFCFESPYSLINYIAPERLFHDISKEAPSVYSERRCEL
jgi:hypothetical protein